MKSKRGSRSLSCSRSQERARPNADGATAAAASTMGDFAAGKMLDPVSVLRQLIEQKAPELHETLQPVPPATADALAAAPAALRPFLAAHDGGWEIYEYVLCSCAEMAPSAAGLAIANHKFDEGDKLCLDEANAACTTCTRSLRSARAAHVRG